jgi:hypothetical protein
VSYCRFSSDNWKSEVYVYANVSGAWTIHVAGNKVVGPVPEEDLSFLDLEKDSPEWQAAADRWVASHKVAMDYLRTAERRDITLPFAGETFDTASPGECADKLQELVDIGYHVPDGVIADLREEQQATLW